MKTIYPFSASIVIWTCCLLILAFIVNPSTQINNNFNIDSYISKISSIVDLNEFCLSIEEKEKKLILQKSTILHRLRGYIRHESTASKIDPQACKEAIEIQLSDLKNVIDDSSSDICQNEKITAIENFHYNYVQPDRKHYQQKKSNRYFSSYLVLNNYFMIYASEVSSVCEQKAKEEFGLFMKFVEDTSTNDLGKNAEKDQEKLDSIEMVRQLGALDDFIASVSKTFSISMKPNYENMFMPWNLVKVLQQKLDFQLDQIYKFENNRLSVQMKNADTIQRLQNFCKSYAKPTYALSLLPVMRLVDLGYYPDKYELIHEIGKSKWSVRHYMLVHLCELVLPVNAITKKELSDHEIVVVKREDFSIQQGNIKEDTSLSSSDSYQSDEDDISAYSRSPFINPRDALRLHKIMSDVGERRKRMESMLWILLTRIGRRFKFRDFYDMFKRDNNKMMEKKERDKYKEVVDESSKLPSKLFKNIYWNLTYYLGVKFFAIYSTKAIIASVVIYDKLFVKPYAKMCNLIWDESSVKDKSP